MSCIFWKKIANSKLFNSYDVSVFLMNIYLLLWVINVAMNCIFPILEENYDWLSDTAIF